MSDPILPPKPCTFTELEAVVNKWLLIADSGLLKVIAGVVVAHKLNADPVWLFVVAPPGGSKTELIRGLNQIPCVYALSDLTPQTFLSGDRGKNSSLLTRLNPNTLLTLKDFTTILTMHRDNRHAILSQLREIFDGSYSKAFGTGETKVWEGKLGFIAGVTSVIDTYQSVFQVLGERFIQYRPEQPDGVVLAKRAMKNSGKEKEMRDEIQAAFAGFIENLEITEELSPVPEDLEESVANLASLIVKARSGVIRDGYSTREIEFIPDAELPTRLAKQLITLHRAFTIIDNSNPAANYDLVFKVALDSLPQKRRKTLENLFTTVMPLETTEVATAIGYPTNTTRKTLEDLSGLGLVDRLTFGRGFADKWCLSSYAKMLLEKAKPANFEFAMQGVPDVSEGTLKTIDQVFGIAGEQPTLPEMSGE